MTLFKLAKTEILLSEMFKETDVEDVFIKDDDDDSIAVVIDDTHCIVIQRGQKMLV